MLDTQLCPTLWLHELWHARLLCPWTFPDKKTGVGCHTLLQGTFLTQGVNLGLLHWRQTLYHLSHQGSQIGILVIVICSNHFKAPVWQCYLRYYCLCLRPGEKTKVFFFFLSCPISQSQEIHGLVKNDHSVLVDILLCHVINSVIKEWSIVVCMVFLELALACLWEKWSLWNMCLCPSVPWVRLYPWFSILHIPGSYPKYHAHGTGSLFVI